MNIFAETSDVTKKLLDGVMEQVTITDEEAFVNDKVTKVIRTRVTAEICSTLVKLHSLKILDNKMLIQKMSKWLIDNQNSNGSWNETHINYNQPSTVFTSVCALSLLEVSESFPEFNINEEIFDKAAKFILDQEIDFGAYKKSEHVHADILNADAMAAAFLLIFACNSLVMVHILTVDQKEHILTNIISLFHVFIIRQLHYTI